MHFHGEIYEYNNEGSIAFKNDIEHAECTVVLIGGLGDNILTLPYLAELNEFLKSRQISLVIPQLRSMPLFTITPIESDIDDISDVVENIESPVVLIGHSTGCNDILLYIERSMHYNVIGVVLQAPVSDTEAMPRLIAEHNLELIKASDPRCNYIELQDETLWLKERYVSLYSIGGEEDLFSTYLEEEAYAKWKDRVPIMSVLSDEDEFCKNPPIEKFRLMGSVHVINNANHNLTGKNAQNQFLALLDVFFHKLGLNLMT